MSEVHVKSLERQNIRTLLGMRRRLMIHFLATEAMLKSLVKAHGGRLPLGRRKTGYTYAINLEYASAGRCGLQYRQGGPSYPRDP